MGLVFETLPTLAVADCRGVGLFRSPSRVFLSGEWTRGTEAAPFLTAKITAVPSGISISYTYEGREQVQNVAVSFRAANYGDRWRVPVFLCPETGRACRSLYFVGGRFVSRFAFRGVYRSQTVTKSRRVFVREEQAQRDLLDLYNDTRRRRSYKGNPTRYARQLDRAAKRSEDAGKAAQVAEFNAKISALLSTSGKWGYY